MGMLANAVKAGMLSSGTYRSRLRRAPFAGLATLCYHNVLPNRCAGTVPFRALHLEAATLRAHCRMLKRHCNPVSAAQVAAALAGGPALPDRAVLLTFDDGYRNMLTVAAPVLVEEGVPALFFVCPGATDGSLLWFDAAAAAQGDAAAKALKELPNAERAARCAALPNAPEVCPAAARMTPDEVRALAALPGMAIGAHTLTHPILALCSSAEQRDEIAGSRAILAEWLGAAPAAFAYPNGRPEQDFVRETEELTASAGFAMAFTTQASFAFANQSRFHLPRFVMTDYSPAELAHRLAVSWSRG